MSYSEVCWEPNVSREQMLVHQYVVGMACLVRAYFLNDFFGELVENVRLKYLIVSHENKYLFTNMLLTWYSMSCQVFLFQWLVMSLGMNLISQVNRNLSTNMLLLWYDIFWQGLLVWMTSSEAWLDLMSQDNKYYVHQHVVDMVWQGLVGFIVSMTCSSLSV